MSTFNYYSVLISQWGKICNNISSFNRDELYDFADRLRLYATRVGEKRESLEIYNTFLDDMRSIGANEHALQSIEGRKELDWSRLDIIFRRLPKQEEEYYKKYTKAVMTNRSRVSSIHDARRLILGALAGNDAFREEAFMQEIQNACTKYPNVVYASNVYSTWFKKIAAPTSEYKPQASLVNATAGKLAPLFAPLPEQQFQKHMYDWYDTATSMLASQLHMQRVWRSPHDGSVHYLESPHYSDPQQRIVESLQPERWQALKTLLLLQGSEYDKKSWFNYSQIVESTRQTEQKPTTEYQQGLMLLDDLNNLSV
jgi:hypothetical protein